MRSSISIQSIHFSASISESRQLYCVVYYKAGPERLINSWVLECLLLRYLTYKDVSFSYGVDVEDILQGPDNLERLSNLGSSRLELRDLLTKMGESSQDIEDLFSFLGKPQEELT